jgi:TatD DNase family protein
LLEKLGVDFDLEIVNSWFESHELAFQSTVSTDNFLDTSFRFREFEKLKFFLGSHPELVTKDFDLKLYLAKQQQALQTLNLSDFIGIGEIGLDYFYTQNSEIITKQKQLFDNQIKLAIAINKPIMIHCRNAFEDLFAILRQNPEIHGKFLIHCFTGNSWDLGQILDMDGYVGIGGVVTFASAKNLRQAVVECPLDKLVIETDLPFLSPNRGQICMPKDIELVAQKISDLKNLSTDLIWQNTRKNLVKLFGL